MSENKRFEVREGDVGFSALINYNDTVNAAHAAIHQLMERHKSEYDALVRAHQAAIDDSGSVINTLFDIQGFEVDMRYAKEFGVAYVSEVEPGPESMKCGTCSKPAPSIN